MSSPKTPERPTSAELSPGTGVRTGLSVADLKQSFLDHLFCGLGRMLAFATPNDAYTALAFVAVLFIPRGAGEADTGPATATLE